MVRVTNPTRLMSCIISNEKDQDCISAMLGLANCAVLRNSLHGSTDFMKARLLTNLLQVLTQAQPLERQVLSCMYLAHHELESV